MKKQVVYIHGGDSFSEHEDFLQDLRTKTIRSLPGTESNKFWTETLQEDLGEDFELFKLAMPNKQNAQYEEWKIWFERHFEYSRDGVIFVGWSLGGMFLAKYLSEEIFPVQIKSLYMLGAPCGVCVDESGNDCGSFQFAPEILQNITKNVQNINVWHSKDDFVVPYEHALDYKKHIEKATLATFEDKNHFLLAGFPELITDIKNLDRI
jgi:predicted alpha/beta hydrolase family esterase